MIALRNISAIGTRWEKLQVEPIVAVVPTKSSGYRVMEWAGARPGWGKVV